MRAADTFRLVAYAVIAIGLAMPARAEEQDNCFSDSSNRLEACSALIDTPGIESETKSLAFTMRALAYFQKGALDSALTDYDQAIQLDPGSSVALNNRAWVLFKMKRTDAAMEDVERSLSISPSNPYAYDTLAHIYQALGKSEYAVKNYDRAMRLGGVKMITLYQCGLQAHGYYNGTIDGIYRSELRQGLEACVADSKCDPLPVEEDCHAATS